MEASTVASGGKWIGKVHRYVDSVPKVFFYADANNNTGVSAAIGGLDPGVTRKWLAGRLAGCCLLIDRLHGLNSLFLIIRSACMHD